jgi:hypothetical protein
MWRVDDDVSTRSICDVTSSSNDVIEEQNQQIWRHYCHINFLYVLKNNHELTVGPSQPHLSECSEPLEATNIFQRVGSDGVLSP